MHSMDIYSIAIYTMENTSINKSKKRKEWLLSHSKTDIHA